jgi:hypothetical protein
MKEERHKAEGVSMGLHNFTTLNYKIYVIEM